MQFEQQFRQSLTNNLTPEELMRMDELITPELAHLCVKAFGPDMAALFEPFIENDMPQPSEGYSQASIQNASIQNMKGV